MISYPIYLGFAGHRPAVFGDGWNQGTDGVDLVGVGVSSGGFSSNMGKCVQMHDQGLEQQQQQQKQEEQEEDK